MILYNSLDQMNEVNDLYLEFVEGKHTPQLVSIIVSLLNIYHIIIHIIKYSICEAIE